ncbi:hypothetical protein BGZ59_000596 [Podila verticillata]|nr:hypothetical protein BGZ59_000596 [Podila verticillata]KFH63438.1 hypothetical protein MVEG_10848 [Podila verticillata NRRL 6337]
MAPVSHFAELLLLLPIAIISLVLSVEFVHAQSPFSPYSTGNPASVFIEGKAFYIQGGSTQQQNRTNQTFSISLSSSWNTTNPIYIKLPDGLYDSQFPNALLNDSITWLALSNNSFFTYNIPDGKITRRAPATIFSNFSGLHAVYHRGLGEVVIPNGYSNGFQTIDLSINPETLSTRFNPNITPLSDISGWMRYSLAWSESAQKAFLFGGSTLAGTLYSALYERNSSALGNWNRINATLAGQTVVGGPSPRESACMVPAFNGTKLILFGGSGPTGIITWNVALSDIFIYDVAKAEWTKGNDAGSTRARAAHACAVSGDALIVWGGFSNMDVKGPAVEMIAIYNITTNLWVDKFISPTVEQKPTLTSSPTGTANPGSGSGFGPETTSNTSGSGSNTGAIIGGVAGAVVVLAGLGFAVWRRGSLKKRTTFSKVHQHQRDGSHNFKEPAEQIRDPHSAPNVPPAPQPVVQNVRHPQLRNSWQEQAHHQQSDDGLYDYRDPVARSNNPHGDLSVQRAPQIPPRPTNSFRGPQLDILRRERELAAELEMLRNDRGNTPQVQRYDNWSTHKSGNGSPHA